MTGEPEVLCEISEDLIGPPGEAFKSSWWLPSGAYLTWMAMLADEATFVGVVAEEGEQAMTDTPSPYDLGSTPAVQEPHRRVPMTPITCHAERCPICGGDDGPLNSLLPSQPQGLYVTAYCSRCGRAGSVLWKPVAVERPSETERERAERLCGDPAGDVTLDGCP